MVVPQWAQRYTTSVRLGLYQSREQHYSVGRTERGTLTLRACAQVKNYRAVLLVFHIHLSITPYILTTPGQSVSTPAAIAITAIVCLITGALFCALVTVCISRWNKKERSSKPAPNTQEQQQAAVVYEEVDTLQSQKFELKQNVAYGPVKQEQTFELKENVAYEPVKPNQ